MNRARSSSSAQGPGDPELLTLKAARALGRADVVLIDALVNRGCLRACAPRRAGDRGRQARRLQVDAAGLHREAHAGACARTGPYRRAPEGRRPVRLRPRRRGAGSTRARTESRSKSFPASPPAPACPAALGIPVTHRDLAHGVTFVTGHGRRELDWDALARSGTTLVIYMGLRKLAGISRRLLAAGMDPLTPACIIENGTLDDAEGSSSPRSAGFPRAGFRGPGDRRDRRSGALRARARPSEASARAA